MADGKICNAKDHHTLLHKDVAAGGAKPAKKGKTDTYQTESSPKPGGEVPPTSSSSSEPASAAPASAPQPETVGQDITEVNSIRCFNASPSECYLADQMEAQDQYKLANCGTVTLKGSPPQRVLCMFDLCSTDNWVTQGMLKTVQFSYLQPFNGLVRTMNGSKRMVLPRVMVRVQLDESWLKIVCLVVPDIGVKAKIESNRFERLVKSFNLQPHQFDQSSGPIGLLIGLAQQRYGTNRIGEFISAEYP